jgi:hypothetical protein
VHHLLEYVLAGALAELSVHIGRSGLLVAAAGAFALLALTARGPLGIARVCGPKLHATLDIAVAVAVAAAPLFPTVRPDLNGIVVVEVAALAWLRLSTLTRYTPSAPGGAGTGAAASLTAVMDPNIEGQRSDAGTAPATGAAVARGLGILAGRSARRLPAAEASLRSGARRAGRQTARLRTWRKPSS